MLKIEITIGSPNDTHRMSPAYKTIIKEWADRVLKGYQWTPSLGQWQGQHEESVTLTHITSKDLPLSELDSILEALPHLKRALRQESILISWQEINAEFI